MIPSIALRCQCIALDWRAFRLYSPWPGVSSNRTSSRPESWAARSASPAAVLLAVDDRERVTWRHRCHTGNPRRGKCRLSSTSCDGATPPARCGSRSGAKRLRERAPGASRSLAADCQNTAVREPPCGLAQLLSSAVAVDCSRVSHSANHPGTLRRRCSSAEQLLQRR